MGTLGNAIPTLSDYLQIVSGGFVAPQPSRWVRLVNNATSTAYVSTAPTDSNGIWTATNVPTGTYTISYSVNVGGPWTATGDSNYLVPNAPDTGAATGAAGSATLNKQAGTITTENLTTAALGVQGYTVGNSLVATTSQVFVAVRNGTNTVQPVYATNVVPGSGLFTVDFRNGHASLALTGSLKFAFWVVP